LLLRPLADLTLPGDADEGNVAAALVDSSKAASQNGDSRFISNSEPTLTIFVQREIYSMLKRTFLGLALVVAAVSAAAAAPGEAFTDPKEAGKDFEIQGEYVGGEGDERRGAQIIALGDGKFQGIGYSGGLPGDGWSRGDEVYKSEGEWKDDAVVFKTDEFTASAKDGKLTIKDTDGNQVMEMKKVERKSPTLGAKPPEGAKVLFDGTTADNFENGQLVDGKYLGATNCTSKEKVGDHTLHIEFRTPFMPKARGQGRGNSGVYMQSRYELQVLDSFGLEGENNECGGIYQIAKPKVNMCLPPLAWQTYDIEFTAAKYDNGKKTENARATIKHNGVTIHDNLELPHGTPGRAQEGPEELGIFLQDHGNPVVFQNIWVVEKK